MFLHGDLVSMKTDPVVLGQHQSVMALHVIFGLLYMRMNIRCPCSATSRSDTLIN